MTIAIYFLLGFLIICAASVALTKDLLSAILIQMGYSTIMSVIWLLLESPDLAITEAAVGAVLSTVIFIIAIRKTTRKEDEEQ